MTRLEELERIEVLETRREARHNNSMGVPNFVAKNISWGKSIFKWGMYIFLGAIVVTSIGDMFRATV